MTKILLTRHGHVDGIKPARFRGRAELPLTAHGLAQAEATLGVHVKREIIASMIELVTSRHDSLAAAREEPKSVRRGLAKKS